MILDWINEMKSPWNVMTWIGLFIAVFAMCILITKLSNAVFRRIQKRHPGLHVMFLHHILTIIIVLGFIILVVSALAGVKTVWSTLFGGTAIISAVLAFAAQDIIKDVLAGMMISAHNPFKVGDRVTLDDGTTGVVEDITLHHVVIAGVESLKYVIPNHVINSMRLTSYNFQSTTRSVVFKFSIGYDSDMTEAKQVIAQAIEDSEYSIKGRTDKNGIPCYGDVYFMSFADSALILQTTVYFRPCYPSERVIDDINVRVREALIEHNIEIPYNYVNVVEKPDEPAKKPIKKTLPKATEKPKLPAAAPAPAKIEAKPAAKAPVKTVVKAPVKATVKAPAKATAPVTAKPATATAKPAGVSPKPAAAPQKPANTAAKTASATAKPAAKPTPKPAPKPVPKKTK